MTRSRMRLAAALIAAALVAVACSRPPDSDEVSTDEPSATTEATFDVGADADGPTSTQPSPDEEPDASTTTAVAGEGEEAAAPTGDDDGDGSAPETSAPATTVAPSSGPTLWEGEDDVRGITDDTITFCVHAALTYGAAFNTSAEDLNVYWEAVNDNGGVHGREVQVHYENDNYSPDEAIEAAKACKDKYDPFALLGGIGFDQIPAVRNWAENNQMLYIHHTATTNGSEGKQYSFTPLATTEKMGELFAELADTDFNGQEVGIIKRQSPNWEPGIDGFKKVAAERGVPISMEREVAVNKGTYLQDIVDLRNAGTEVVFLWLNALESTEFISQTWAQGWKPQFMVFPFNLTTQTLGSEALDPPIVGVMMHNAYSAHDTSGPFAAYADDIEQFEAQYDEYQPDADYEGVGGDLMFLNWTSQKTMHKFLLDCGRDCTRSEFVELLRQAKGTPTSSACPVDFTHPGSGGGHRGGFRASVLEAYEAPGDKINFRNSRTCVEHIGG